MTGGNRTTSPSSSPHPRRSPGPNSFWSNRIEAQLTALRYFALDGTDHPTHKAQGSMIRRYILRRNKHAADERLRTVVATVTAA